MRCAWNELISILPMWMRDDVDRLGRVDLQELRLRLGQQAELVCGTKQVHLDQSIRQDDLHFVINTASRYSPWTAQTTAYGFITAPGGHRIGLCGEAVVQNGIMTGIRRTDSLCIRVARDFPGIAIKAKGFHGSILIIGPPGSGKTTLLRDLIRQRGTQGTVSVVDERGEIFPQGFYRGMNTDVLTGVGKEAGIDCVIRTMNPNTVAVDEITSETDCFALSKACWCGVSLLATAHAGSVQEFKRRSVYAPLVQSRIFEHVIVLSRDKSWHMEGMDS